MKKILLAILLFLSFAPSAFAAQMLVGGSPGSASATVEQFTTLTSSTNIGSATAISGLMPLSGSIGTVRIHISPAPGAGTSRQFTLMKNEATSTAPSCTISDTNTDCTISNASLGFVSGDRILMADNPVNTPATAAVLISALMTPVIPGSMLIQGRSSGTVDPTSEQFFQIAQVAVTTPGTLEASTTQLIPVPGTLDSLYSIFTATPGAGKNFTFSLRKNFASTTLSATIADTNLTGNDTTNSVSVSQLDMINMASVPFNTPTARTPAVALRFRATDPTISSIFIYSSMSAVDSNVSARVAPLSGERTINVSTANIALTQTAMAAPITFTTMVASSTPPGGVATRSFFLQVNGVTTNFGCTLVGAAATCSYTGNLRVQQGQFVNWVDTPSGTPQLGNPLISLASQDPHGKLVIPQTQGKLIVKGLLLIL